MWTWYVNRVVLQVIVLTNGKQKWTLLKFPENLPWKQTDSTNKIDRLAQRMHANCCDDTTCHISCSHKPEGACVTMKRTSGNIKYQSDFPQDRTELQESHACPSRIWERLHKLPSNFDESILALLKESKKFFSVTRNKQSLEPSLTRCSIATEVCSW